MSNTEIFFTILGMAAVTQLCRCFFLLPKEDLPMPRWLQEGLRYAPIAALMAVVAPEIVMTQGHLIHTWRDARLFGAATGLAFYVWRQDLLTTIVTGTGVMLVLRFGLGW
ncbi:AzlD domain-containing protein [Ramlibacter sp. G-1-2-2]|uniref:AzlD domain-containing protein n=1 Tax=Ramlibacter agri TaxID=2728837 RepID=A0A848HBV0_9BURK|nr:AzlD domain-containing protein [Ramlibacter agri]NML47552.1 AzlD domain-containing protein [Ramlibacter agri]